MFDSSLGRYSSPEVKQPLVFSTEIASTFKRVTEREMGKLDKTENEIERLEERRKEFHRYEKTIHGLINVRTNGRWLALGRVYGGEKGPEGGPATVWNWEAYAFNLANGKMTEELPP